MMLLISAFLQLVVSNNLLMSLLKALSAKAQSKGFLRAILAVLSLAGVIAANALNGNPVDLDSVTYLLTIIIESFAVGLGSHLSYKAIKTA